MHSAAQAGARRALALSLEYPVRVMMHTELVATAERLCISMATARVHVASLTTLGRARTADDARPAGMQRITRTGHLASRCNAIYLGTTRASRLVSSS